MREPESENSGDGERHSQRVPHCTCVVALCFFLACRIPVQLVVIVHADLRSRGVWTLVLPGALPGPIDSRRLTTTPRSHLGFSLNPYPDPDLGKSIRKYALNPLLLFPPFGYGDPYTHQRGENGVPVYQFVIDPEAIDAPSKRSDGSIEIEIHAGSVAPDGAFQPARYFALNSLEISVFNGGEQGDVYRMGAVLPARWLKTLNYDWSKPGSIAIRASSIWDGYLDGHSEMVEIRLPAK